MFLVYGGDKELIVNGYIDASFDTDPDDSKLQTGYVFILNGGAISWSSSKQSIMAGSMCEVEYVAALEAANEGVWMKEFISDLRVIPSASGPMKKNCGQISSYKSVVNLQLRKNWLDSSCMSWLTCN